MHAHPLKQVPPLTCRFADERFDDRRMEVGWAAVQAEERRSARLGRDDDAAAEAQERARQVKFTGRCTAVEDAQLLEPFRVAMTQQ